MANVADDLGPDVDPEPGAWPPVPRPAGSVPERTDGSVAEPTTGSATAPAPAPVRQRPKQTQRRAAVPVREPIPSTERRYRQTVAKVDLWSVLKMAVCFYICAMAVLVVALVVLWSIADAAGVITSVEKFFGDLLQTKDFTFLDQEILRGSLLVAAVTVVLLVVITVIAAAFYNMFAELFGGIELTIQEDETNL